MTEQLLDCLIASGALNNSENGRPGRWRIEAAREALEKTPAPTAEIGRLEQAVSDVTRERAAVGLLLHRADAALADARKREQSLAKALASAAKVARNLMEMIDQDTWRSTGGDDGQGHYEGDYRAERLVEEIKEWMVLADEPAADKLPPCSECGRPWEDHYRPDALKFKSGPHGTFGLKEGDHTPHIPGLHAERAEDEPLTDADYAQAKSDMPDKVADEPGETP